MYDTGNVFIYNHTVRIHQATQENLVWRSVTLQLPRPHNYNALHGPKDTFPSGPPTHSN